MNSKTVEPSKIPTLAELGYSEAQIIEIATVCKATAGVTVSCGPTNSGMSTAVGIKAE